MTLLDSNIIIYAAKPEFVQLRDLIRIGDSFASAISLVEVLGFHKLSEVEREVLEAFFNELEALPINEAVLKRAVGLRQTKKMTLGDALVAATALVHDLELVTHNTQDFEWIESLRLFDPLAET